MQRRGDLARHGASTRPDGKRASADDLGGRRPIARWLAPSGCDLTALTNWAATGALFSPQGGLRISVRALTVIGRLLLHRGVHAGDRLLSEASVREMVTPAWTFDGANGDTEGGFYCAYGLGVQSLPVAVPGCRDALFGRGRAMQGHAGDAYGLRSGLWIDARRRTGIAFFATGNGEDPPRGRRSAYRAIEEALAGRLR